MRRRIDYIGLCIVLFLGSLDGTCSTSNAQSAPSRKKLVSIDARAAEIKRMYAEVQGLLRNSSNVSCIEAKRIEYDDPEPDYNYPHEQFARHCTLPLNYSVYSATLRGHESLEDVTFYFKGKQLFFVYSEGGAESFAFEQRSFYDERGNVLQLIERTNEDEPGGSVGKPITYRDPERMIAVRDGNSDTLAKIRKILNNAKHR